MLKAETASLVEARTKHSEMKLELGEVKKELGETKGKLTDLGATLKEPEERWVFPSSSSYLVGDFLELISLCLLLF